MIPQGSAGMEEEPRGSSGGAGRGCRGTVWGLLGSDRSRSGWFSLLPLVFSCFLLVFPCFPPFLPVFPCFFPSFPVFPCFSPFFPCFPLFSHFFPAFPYFSCFFPGFPLFPHLPVFPCFPLFFTGFSPFPCFFPVSPCFSLLPPVSFPVSPWFSPMFPFPPIFSLFSHFPIFPVFPSFSISPFFPCFFPVSPYFPHHCCSHSLSSSCAWDCWWQEEGGASLSSGAIQELKCCFSLHLISRCDPQHPPDFPPTWQSPAGHCRSQGSSDCPSPSPRDTFCCLGSPGEQNLCCHIIPAAEPRPSTAALTSASWGLAHSQPKMRLFPPPWTPNPTLFLPPTPLQKYS